MLVIFEEWDHYKFWLLRCIHDIPPLHWHAVMSGEFLSIIGNIYASVEWYELHTCYLCTLDLWQTPGFRQDIGCHVWPPLFCACKSPDQTAGHTLSHSMSCMTTLLCLQITRSDIRPHVMSFSVMHDHSFVPVNYQIREQATQLSDWWLQMATKSPSEVLWGFAWFNMFILSSLRVSLL